MKPHAARLRRGLILAFVALLGTACGGQSGSPQVAAPTAVVTPIGYKPTSSQGASPVAITVRSGADVQLSGKDSASGNITITGFVWKQTDSAPVPQVTLLYRTANTVSFTAPSVATDTTLNFQLTVTNQSGQSNSANAQVLVKPANDPNRFLLLPGVPRQFRVGVSTVSGLQNLTADIPVCVTLARTLSYTPRSGGVNSGSFALPVQRVDAKWLASVGGAAGFPSAPYEAFSNPVVAFDLPVRNDEDLFAQLNTPGAPLANELVPSDIDSLYVQMSVSAAPGSCDGTQSGAALSASQLMLQLFGQAGAPLGSPATAASPGAAVTIATSLYPSSPLTPDGSNHLTPDELLQAQAAAKSSNETRASALAYYQAIDPDSSKTTLPAWLGANCFDPNAADYGAGETGYSVVHADYTNNFDLGFGRDMYFANCANGNMASVVVNYPSLEAAINKVGAFLAVAMEYGPAYGSTDVCFTNPSDPTTNTGKCFAKFYSFAPDETSGVFKRVLSANFDRRGPKYLPGSCTICHGGVPSYTTGQPYPAAGNLDSNFLPWDVDSLLFADTDPSFACLVSTISPGCASINASNYTKAAQEPNLKMLNALAWRTYQYVEIKAPSQVDRNQAPRNLLTQWYGGDPAGAAAHAYDDSTTPSAWFTPGQAAASSTDLYHTVFAHYCRSCHTQLNIPSLQLNSYQDLAALLVPTASLKFNSLNVQDLIFGAGEMPLSRLTADRFWVDFNGGTSAAQSLAEAINATPGVQRVAVDSNQNVIGPGRPQIVTGLSPVAITTQFKPGEANTLTRFASATVDALTRSVFASTYQWSLCTQGPPTTPGGPCPGTTLGLIGTPITPAGDSAGAPEAGAGLPALPTNVPGTYFLTVTANSGIPGYPSSTVTYQLDVPQQSPALSGISPCPSTGSSATGTSISIDVTTCFALAQGAPQLGDAPYRLQISTDGVQYSDCINTANCAQTNVSLLLAASVTSGDTVNAAGQNGFIPTITFQFIPPGTMGGTTLYYRWCDVDAVCVSGSAAIALTP